MENNAAVLYGPKDLRVVNWPTPVINENEVLIKMECVGICGSDVKLYSSGKCGLEVLSEPIVMGHEGAGTVVQVGSKVTNLAVGDRVAVEPTQPCRSCDLCKQGRYNLCVKPSYCSTGDTSGNICNYYKHVADFCHKIPDNVTLEEGAAVQPLAIAIHACSRANIRLGSVLVVLGAGPIGVLCALTARAMGVSKILMTDVVESRLKIAKELVADYTLLVKPDSKNEDVVDEITKMLGTCPHVAIDACGYESSQGVAMLAGNAPVAPLMLYGVVDGGDHLPPGDTYARLPCFFHKNDLFPKVTRSGGTVLVVGIGEAYARVPLSNAMLREVDVRGAYRLLNSYPVALAAVSSGAIDLKSFITHHFPLEKSKEALEYAATGEAMKIIIHL